MMNAPYGFSVMALPLGYLLDFVDATL